MNFQHSIEALIVFHVFDVTPQLPPILPQELFTVASPRFKHGTTLKINPRFPLHMQDKAFKRHIFSKVLGFTQTLGYMGIVAFSPDELVAKTTALEMKRYGAIGTSIVPDATLQIASYANLLKMWAEHAEFYGWDQSHKAEFEKALKWVYPVFAPKHPFLKKHAETFSSIWQGGIIYPPSPSKVFTHAVVLEKDEADKLMEQQWELIADEWKADNFMFEWDYSSLIPNSVGVEIQLGEAFMNSLQTLSGEMNLDEATVEETNDLSSYRMKGFDSFVVLAC